MKELKLDTEKAYSQEEVQKFLEMLPGKSYTSGYTLDNYWFMKKEEYRFQCNKQGINENYFLVSYPQQ